MPQNLQERRVGLDPEHELTHRLEVRLAALELLGHRVDVPEPAVEGAVDEDRGRAGGVMRDVGDRLRLMNRVGRGEPISMRWAMVRVPELPPRPRCPRAIPSGTAARS